MPSPREMPPILDVTDLRKDFVVKRSLFGRPLAQVSAVDGVSLRLRPGETLAIVGESGCGKSTIGRMLTCLLEPSAGRIVLDGVEIGQQGRQDMLALRRKIQLVFQDPYASLNPRMTVGQAIAEPLMLHGIVPPAQYAERVGALLEMVGLRPEHAGRYPHEFSGGQRQRVVIARALAPQPKVIVCDEAVSALDVSIQAQILNLLKSLQKSLGIAFIFISHDLSVVKHVSDAVAVMYLGKVVETGTTEEIFAAPRHPYTRALLSAIPVTTPHRPDRGRAEALSGDLPSPIDPPSGCRLHTRCPFARPACAEAAMQLEFEPGGHGNACIRWKELPPPGEVAPPAGAKDQRLERLFAAFSRPVPALEEGP